MNLRALLPLFFFFRCDLAIVEFSVSAKLELVLVSMEAQRTDCFASKLETLQGKGKEFNTWHWESASIDLGRPSTSQLVMFELGSRMFIANFRG